MKERTICRLALPLGAGRFRWNDLLEDAIEGVGAFIRFQFAGGGSKALVLGWIEVTSLPKERK